MLCDIQYLIKYCRTFKPISGYIEKIQTLTEKNVCTAAFLAKKFFFTLKYFKNQRKNREMSSFWFNCL